MMFLFQELRRRLRLLAAELVWASAYVFAVAVLGR
jgi:hypothetical protein